MLRHKFIATLLLVLCGIAFVAIPAHARFLQVDPVGYKDDIDWYTYVQNDPTDKTDPTGLQSAAGITMGAAVASCGTDTACIQQVNQANAKAASMVINFVLDSAPGTGEYRAIDSFANNPTLLNAAIVGLSLADLGGVAKVTKMIGTLEKGAATLEKNALAHELKAAEFAANPTVKSEMAGMSQEAIAKQQAARVEKLQKEAAEYRRQAAEKRTAAEELRKKLPGEN